MLRFLACLLLLVLGSSTDVFAASCATFTGSTMDVGGFPKAQWRTDYPAAAGTPTMPWKGIDFRTEPARYMEAVLSTARSSFRRSGTALVGTGTEEWWASLWLDYTTNGREPLMGLTKERGARSR